MADLKVLLIIAVIIPTVSFITGSIEDLIVPADDEGEIDKQINGPQMPDIRMELPEDRIADPINVKVGDKFEVLKAGTWNEVKVKGVNMGMAKPGYYPGEAAITYEEYSRWISQISEMNANTIRTYSAHPPQFYRALAEHNCNSKNTLYLLQGVWVNEEKMAKAESVLDVEFTEDMNSRVNSTIDVLHGSSNGYSTPGIPEGFYYHDVSQYVLGIIIGMEWDPGLVMATNDISWKSDQINGTYIKTDKASPFEIWLGGVFENAIEYETTRYSHQTPLSFINYQSLDKMEHPEEPFEIEDRVSVDPDNIKAKNTFESSLFATFHVYPYYPDFMNLNNTYSNSLDANGECNNFAGYLRDLHSCHETPILIGEFGVPSSDGISHHNIHGMDQGHLTEEQQGLIDAKLFKTIIEEDLMGGVLFSWHDEWFKTSWNTVHNINRSRNPYWYNSLNCEENYGLLSFDPGDRRSIMIDGKQDDWLKCNEDVKEKELNNGVIKKIAMTNDEGYIYFSLSGTIEEDTKIMVLIDTIDDHGSGSIPGGFETGFGSEFILDINGNNGSRVLVNGEYDTFAHRYDPESVTNPYNPVRMFLRSQITDVLSGEEIPADVFEIGHLEHGVTDPTSFEYNSNADIFMNTHGGLIEVRIPWNLLNIKDPSTKEIIGPKMENGDFSSEHIDSIGVGLVTLDGSEGILLGGTIHEDASQNSNIMERADLIRYSWDGWTHPDYHERLKGSYYIMKEIFKDM